MLYIKLFLNFLMIGALSFGGGYGTLSLIEEVAVEKWGWITPEQLYDVITLSEITPGPIALNAASFTGYNVGGLLGSVAATIGCVFPSCVVMALLTYVYSKFGKTDAVSNVIGTIKPAVCSLVFAAFITVFLPVCFGITSVLSFGSASINIVALLIFAVGIIVLQTKKVSPIVLILASGALGAVLL